MALQKQELSLNFAKGLDTKTDPNQIAFGKFAELNNADFETILAMKKRNGYDKLSTLSVSQTNLTTYNDTLVTTGANLLVYAAELDKWTDKGNTQPVSFDVLSLVRTSKQQLSPDLAVASNKLGCLVYTEDGQAYYQVLDTTNGEYVAPRVALPATATHPRVYVLDSYFAITYKETVTGAPHLKITAITIGDPTQVTTLTVSTSVGHLTDSGYDAYYYNSNLYIGWEGAGNTVKVARITSTLIVSAVTTLATQNAARVSVTVDASTPSPVIWVSWWNSATNNAFTANFNQFIIQTLAPTQFLTGVIIDQLTSVATNNVLATYYQVINTYSFAPNNRTDYIASKTVTFSGTVGSQTISARSVGLMSKAFYYGTSTYFFAGYQGVNEPTHFLMTGSGQVILKFAFQNAGGYISTQVLPNVNRLDTLFHLPYRVKGFITTENKTTDPTSTAQNAIFTQLGLNLAKLTINDSTQFSSEVASSLHLTGGILWQYDGGDKAVESNFHLFPEDIAVTTATGAGALTAQTYAYQFIYEWTDNQGIIHQSAPSVPVYVTTTTASSTNTISVPTLRLTYKTNVRIVGYRWSTAQQTYYQFTNSTTSPVLNDPTVDSITIVDAAADTAIVGNRIIYTAGDVIENIAPPASKSSALFKNRLFLISAEDDSIWYSKEVAPGTPVEMSDLLQLYLAPTTGVQGSTGESECLAAMDDKLVIFKKNAAYYLTGNGPTITGANNDFGDPVFITGSVGCSNQNSIALIPQGLVFQSAKGIWLLDRSLTSTYIGADVEKYNSKEVKSTEVIPGRNQVRFIIEDGITLVYDYYRGQWSTYSNVRAISGTIYGTKHAYLNDLKEVYTENTTSFKDNTAPVLMSFKTSWINLAGLQGYERLYFMHLLGTYKSPFKLNVEIAYDYNPSPAHNILVTPPAPPLNYGEESNYSDAEPYASISGVFEARIFPKIQKCEAFQVTVTEVVDSNYPTKVGEGLSLSALNLTIGVKKGYRVSAAKRSFGK